MRRHLLYPFILLLAAIISLGSSCTVEAEALRPTAPFSGDMTDRSSHPRSRLTRKRLTGPLDKAFRKITTGASPVQSTRTSLGVDVQHQTFGKRANATLHCKRKRSQQPFSADTVPKTDESPPDDPSRVDDASAKNQTMPSITDHIDQDSVGSSHSGKQDGQGGSTSCFPALNFRMPDHHPSSTAKWWCSPTREQAFLGFSYQVEHCPSRSQLTTDFKRMRSEFHSRYVRIYGACDSTSFNDDLIESAWAAGVGVYPLIWFGFDGDSKWKARKRRLMQVIRDNSKAPFVVRGVVVGSEPLFDRVLPVAALVQQIEDIKNELHPYSDYSRHGDAAMQVTLSEMSWSFQRYDSQSRTLDAATIIQANVLPFFSWNARYGNSADALNGIKSTFSYLRQHSGGHKKIIFAQTGWPSTDEVWKANSKTAVASVGSEAAYFRLLDRVACEDPLLRNGPQGGLAWFAHIWNDKGLPGWGILDSDGDPKFHFSPRTSCH